MSALEKKQEREEEDEEEEDGEAEGEEDEEQPGEEEPEEEEWATLTKAGNYLKTLIKTRLMKPMAAVRGGRAEKKDLPTALVGNAICKVVTKICKQFVKARKRVPKTDGKPKKMCGIHGLAVVSPALAQFLNKNFPRNSTGQPPVLPNMLSLRGLVTSLLSAYVRVKGLKRKDSSGKTFIFPNAELLALLDTPVVEKEEGKEKKSTVFDKEDVSREHFKCTDVHKLLKYQYLKVVSMDAYLTEKKADRVAEETRLTKIKDESVEETAEASAAAKRAAKAVVEEKKAEIAAKKAASKKAKAKEKE